MRGKSEAAQARCGVYSFTEWAGFLMEEVCCSAGKAVKVSIYLSEGSEKHHGGRHIRVSSTSSSIGASRATV